MGSMTHREHQQRMRRAREPHQAAMVLRAEQGSRCETKARRQHVRSSNLWCALSTVCTPDHAIAPWAFMLERHPHRRHCGALDKWRPNAFLEGENGTETSLRALGCREMLLKTAVPTSYLGTEQALPADGVRQRVVGIPL
jgi:hypothetical protein